MNWDNVTTFQFVELQDITPEYYDNPIDYQMNYISVLLDIPYDDVEELAVEEFNTLCGTIGELPKNTLKESLEISGDTFSFIKNFNNLSFGAYIDIEHFFVQGYYNNLLNLLPIVYRREIKSNSHLFPDKIEEYGDYIFHRARLFEDIPITDTIGFINKYLSWRSNLHESYEGLFSSGDDNQEITDEERENLSDEDIKEIEEIIEADKNMVKFSSEMMIVKLCKLTNLTIDEVYNLNVMLAINLLSMDKETNYAYTK